MWLEMIRMAGTLSNAKASRSLLDLAESIRNVKGLKDVWIGRRANVQDLCVFIQWDSSVPPEQSTTGLMLAELLSAHGSIDHAVWTPCRNTSQPAQLGRIHTP